MSLEIFAKLGFISQVALYTHEALYLMARNQYGSESSLEARWANGYLISTVSPKMIPENVWVMAPAAGIPNKKFACKTTFLDRICFTPSGCVDRSRVYQEYFGKSMAEAVNQYLTVSGRNQNFTPCNRYTRTYPKMYNDLQYVYTCTEVSTVENACFQQF